MNTVSDLRAGDALRSSLDAIDRGRVWKRALTICLLLLGLFFVLAMSSLADSAAPRSTQLEIMSGVIGIILLVLGMGVTMIRVSNANTVRILKALELLSERESKTP